jgi:hypothetical protein
VITCSTSASKTNNNEKSEPWKNLRTHVHTRVPHHHGPTPSFCSESVGRGLCPSRIPLLHRFKLPFRAQSKDRIYVASTYSQSFHRHRPIGPYRETPAAVWAVFAIHLSSSTCTRKAAYRVDIVSLTGTQNQTQPSKNPNPKTTRTSG